MPSNVIAAINSHIFPFVWQRKSEWLSLASITQRPGQGGLEVVNLFRNISSLHITWVKRLLEFPNLPCTYFSPPSLAGCFRRTHSSADSASLHSVQVYPRPFARFLQISDVSMVPSSLLRSQWKIVIGCSLHTFPIDNLSCNTVYKQHRMCGTPLC